MMDSVTCFIHVETGKENSFANRFNVDIKKELEVKSFANFCI